MPALATNEPPNFIVHDEMPALMGTAHHKASGRRHLPSMTRHLTFWMPEALEEALQQSDNGGRKPAEETSAEKERNAWVRHLENFIIEIFVALKESHPKSTAIRAPSLTNFLLPDARADDKVIGLLHHYYQYHEATGRYQIQGAIPGIVRHDAVRLNGIWHSMPIEILFEMYTEYMTIGITLDLGVRRRSVPGVPGALYDDRDENYKRVFDALSTLNRLMTQRYHLLGQKCEAGTPQENKALNDELYGLSEENVELRKAYSVLYQTIIQGQESIWTILRRSLFSPAIEKVGAPNLGRMIGDMRTLYLQRRCDSPHDAFVTIKHPEDDGLAPLMPTLAQIIEGHRFGGAKGVETAARVADIIRNVDTIKPFMLADPRLLGAAFDLGTELSFTTMFEQNGLHASAVSLQNPAPDARITPLPCLSLFTRYEAWEIGRFADTGNRLNTLRLAALYGYGKMADANNRLHAIEQDLNQLQQDLLKILEKEGADDVFDKMVALSGRVAEISNEVPGGIAYRGERSAFYRSQLANLAGLLDLGEVPGHQHFQQMVERRLGPAFEAIHQTNTRLGRINEMMEKIEQTLQTDRQVKAVVTSRRLAERAEFAFWFALFPYYSTSVIVHYILGDNLIEVINHSIGIEKGYDLVTIAVAGLMILIGWSMALRTQAGSSGEVPAPTKAPSQSMLP
jgi:hypothetical protein